MPDQPSAERSTAQPRTSTIAFGRIVASADGESMKPTNVSSPAACGAGSHGEPASAWAKRGARPSKLSSSVSASSARVSKARRFYRLPRWGWIERRRCAAPEVRARGGDHDEAEDRIRKQREQLDVGTFVQ